MMNKERAVLEQARAFVLAGWQQRHPRRGEKRCLVMALDDANQRGGLLDYKEMTELKARLTTLVGTESGPRPFPSYQLIQFNDAKTTTKADVLALLDRALADGAS